MLETIVSAYLSLVRWAYNLVLRTPQGKKKLQSQLAIARIDLKRKLIEEKEANVETLGRRIVIPRQGLHQDELTSIFNKLDDIQKVDWENGKVR